MFDEGSVGHAGDDAVAADVVEAVATDDEIREGGPATVAAPVGPGLDAGAVTVVDVAPLDQDVVEARADVAPDDVEEDAGVALAAVPPLEVRSVDVVDFDVVEVDARERARVFSEYANTSARGRAFG